MNEKKILDLRALTGPIVSNESPNKLKSGENG